MTLLLLSTCGETGVVAAARDGQVVAQEALPGRGASEALLPALRLVFAEAGLSAGELDGIAVVAGPGSFTGVRVGLAAAKGLAEPHGTSLLLLSRLRLVAGPDGTALLDAGRGEVFRGRYRAGATLGEELLRVTPEEAAGARTCEPRLADTLGLELVPEPGAEGLLALAGEYAAQGLWTDAALADALYLRRTDAELKLAAR